MDICSNYPTTPPPTTGQKKAPHTYLTKVLTDGSIQHSFITDKMNDAEAIFRSDILEIGAKVRQAPLSSCQLSGTKLPMTFR